MASVSNVKHSDAEGVLLVGFHGVKRFSGFSSRPLPVIVRGLPRECFRVDRRQRVVGGVSVLVSCSMLSISLLRCSPRLQSLLHFL